MIREKHEHAYRRNSEIKSGKVQSCDSIFIYPYTLIPYTGMSNGNSLEFKLWVLKWVQGVIISFCRNSIQLNRVEGVIRRAKKYGIKNSELLSIIETIENSPVYLPYMGYEEKRTKLVQVREILDKV
jgi:hypothetical protein